MMVESDFRDRLSGDTKIDITTLMKLRIAIARLFVVPYKDFTWQHFYFIFRIGRLFLVSEKDRTVMINLLLEKGENSEHS